MHAGNRLHQCTATTGACLIAVLLAWGTDCVRWCLPEALGAVQPRDLGTSTTISAALLSGL